MQSHFIILYDKKINKLDGKLNHWFSVVSDIIKINLFTLQ